MGAPGDHLGVAASVRRVERAIERAREIRMRVGREIRTARRGAGLSLRAAGASVGVSASAFSRIERGLDENISLHPLCRACAAVGLEFGGRAFLDGDPIRDAGHVRLLARLRQRLAAASPWTNEVPIPLPGDRRAIDAETRLEGRRIGFEAELQLDDIQALERRLALKKRDAGLDVLVLVVADTRRNRDVLARHRESLRPAVPLDARDVLSALGRGVAPAGDGLVVL
jgi:transcriptional regulator with XRE-family HTH domain